MFATICGQAASIVVHNRTPTPLDNQPVIRMNRDTRYSPAVLDLASTRRSPSPTRSAGTSRRTDGRVHSLVYEECFFAEPAERDRAVGALCSFLDLQALPAERIDYFR